VTHAGSTKTVFVGLAAGGLALLLAACGGSPTSGVASVGNATTTTTVAQAGASGNGLPSMAARLAYAQCMRSHGEPDWPDPGGRGGISSSEPTATTVDRNSPQFIAANDACEHFLPSGGVPTQAQNQQRAQQVLKFAQCMRSHGIKDFPDSMQITGEGDLNPSDPQFQAASQACQSLRPGSGGAAP
jgi:hypothetical protein